MMMMMIMIFLIEQMIVGLMLNIMTVAFMKKDDDE